MILFHLTHGFRAGKEGTGDSESLAGFDSAGIPEPSPLVFLSSQQTKPGPYNRSTLSLCLVIPFQPTICQLSQRRPLFTYCCIKPFYYFITVSHSSVGWAQAGGSFPSLASGPHVIAVLSRGSGAGPLSLPTCSAVLTLPRGPPLWGVVSY